MVGSGTALASVVLIVVSYYLAGGFWQNVLIGLATTFLGLGMAVLVVNHFLTSSDKRIAAKPLLKLIAPNVRRYHNELFLRYGYEKFGKDQFQSLVKLYQKHKGDPKAFSPEQRKALYDAIEVEKDDLLRVHDALGEQFRELTLLLGWSFDSRITAAAMDARLNYATFRSLNWDESEETKLSAIESFFDAEAATAVVFAQLTKHLGLQESDWLEEN